MISLIGVVIAGISISCNAEEGAYDYDKDSYSFPVDENKLSDDWSRKLSNFVINPDVPRCAMGTGEEFCWNEHFLRNGLVYHLNTTFYDEYVYGPAVSRPNEVPKKSEMKYDTNPKANWLIGFTRGRNADYTATHNEMLVKSLWGAKHILNEDINVAFVDIKTIEGELLKHTFDVTTFPSMYLVTPEGSYEKNWNGDNWSG